MAVHYGYYLTSYRGVQQFPLLRDAGRAHDQETRAGFFNFFMRWTHQGWDDDA